MPQVQLEKQKVTDYGDIRSAHMRVPQASATRLRRHMQASTKAEQHRAIITRPKCLQRI